MARSTAFTDNHTYAINRIIPDMAKRMLATLEPMPALSHSDVLDMLGVKGEQRNFLEHGRSIIEIRESDANTAFVEVGNVLISLTVNGNNNKPLIPNNPRLCPDWLASTERGQQIVKRAKQLETIADDWGCVEHVFARLNSLMPSEAHVRYVWPSVLALMGAEANNQSLLQKRDKVLPLKVPQSIPSIPMEFRALIRRASTIVTMAAMLPEYEAPSTNLSAVRVVMSAIHRNTGLGYYTTNMSDA